jgi:hypothetical protein
MKYFQPIIRGFILTTLLVAWLAFTASPALAQGKGNGGGGGGNGGGGNGGGGGPAATGTLYVWLNERFEVIPDGGDGAATPLLFGPNNATVGRVGEPGREQHGPAGDLSYYALGFPNAQNNPDGSSRYDIWIADQDFNWTPVPGPPQSRHRTDKKVRWRTRIDSASGEVIVDGALTWLGIEYVTDAADQIVGVSGGLFESEIDWVGGVPFPQPAVKLIDLPVVQQSNGHYHVAASGHDWNVDGSTAILGLTPADGIRLATWDETSGLLDVLDSTGNIVDGFKPEWCPVLFSGRIVFETSDFSIATVDLADGTQQLIAASRERGQKTWTAEDAHWSPDGNFIMYSWVEYDWGKGNLVSDIYRVTADGGNAANLTAETDSLVDTVAWRNY